MKWMSGYFKSKLGPLMALACCNSLTNYLIETPFNTFTNGTGPDQAALKRSTLFAYGNMIRYDPTLVDLKSNFFVLRKNMKSLFI